MNREKISFSHPDFVDFEIKIWGPSPLMDFLKWVHLLFKKQQVSDCQKKISFLQIIHLKIHIFNSWRHQKLLLVANQLQDNNILFENNSEDIGISKLVSQLKLLPTLFELKDNDTINTSTIIKNCKIPHEIDAS